MSEKDQNKLFNSFMEFLRSDLWQIPVSQFIEQRSIGKYFAYKLL